MHSTFSRSPTLQPSNTNTLLDQFTSLDPVYCVIITISRDLVSSLFCICSYHPTMQSNIFSLCNLCKIKLNYVSPHLNTPQWLFNAIGKMTANPQQDPQAPKVGLLQPLFPYCSPLASLMLAITPAFVLFPVLCSSQVGLEYWS